MLNWENIYVLHGLSTLWICFIWSANLFPMLGFHIMFVRIGKCSMILREGGVGTILANLETPKDVHHQTQLSGKVWGPKNDIKVV